MTASSFKKVVATALASDRVVVLPPADAITTLTRLRRARVRGAAVILDPWYNLGVGGVREDYVQFVLRLVRAARHVAPHIFVWGFPEIISKILGGVPTELRLAAWLTWTYKNAQTKRRGWRPAQMACLHFAAPKARMHVENFYAEDQRVRNSARRLRYLPAPPSVIEAGLIVGWCGRSEKTGHPAQKPLKVMKPLLLMASKPGDVIIDVMAGSGTTGAAARDLGRNAILCDHNEAYTTLMEHRLSVSRLSAPRVNPTITASMARLTPSDLEERRRRAVRSYEKGSSQAEVARECGVSREAVRKWVSAHGRRGTKGLAARPRGGRRMKLPGRRLAATFAKGARSFGFNDDRWTGSRAASAIHASTGVRYHPDHARRLARKYGSEDLG